MKQTLQNISSILIGILFCAIGLILLAALSSGCSPKLSIETPTALPWMNEKPKSEPQDTITWIPFQRLDGSIVNVNLDSIINGKVVIDSIIIAGEAFEIHDTIPCPKGLSIDSIVYTTVIKTLPSRKIPVAITTMDTIWLTKPCPPTPFVAPIKNEGTGWGERLAWLSGILLLLSGYYVQYRQRTGRAA